MSVITFVPTADNTIVTDYGWPKEIVGDWNIKLTHKFANEHQAIYKDQFGEKYIIVKLPQQHAPDEVLLVGSLRDD